MDVHRHYCRQCRRPWEHDGDKLTNDVSIRAAHRCPDCGTEGWVKYYGTETHEQMCDMEALLELSEDDRVPEPTRLQAERDFEALARRLYRPNTPTRRQRAELEELAELLDSVGMNWYNDFTGRMSRP